MRNNPWNTPWGQFVKTGAPAGANYAINKYRGCRRIYAIWTIIVGLLLATIGLSVPGSSLLAAGFFLILGLLLIIGGFKNIKG
ncbi:MAG TPA: hypothetical protein VFA41_15980 [Ktedonobacteraceae bacterium]|jgi:hydrogenase/urease accessory protein HupE|nr:hypothetical protein [Ktedonobacteraceae bacterium]